jgi:hypothetical protein
VTVRLEEASLKMETEPAPKMQRYIQIHKFKSCEKACEFKCHTPSSETSRTVSDLKLFHTHPTA